jgi:hypothetical protein
VQEFVVSSTLEYERREKILNALLTAAAGIGDGERTRAAYDLLLRHLSTDVEKTRKVKEKIAERRLGESLRTSFSLARGPDGRIVLTEGR